MDSQKKFINLEAKSSRSVTWKISGDRRGEREKRREKKGEEDGLYKIREKEK